MNVAAKLTPLPTKTHPNVHPSASPLCQVEEQKKPQSPLKKKDMNYKQALKTKRRTTKLDKLKTTIATSAVVLSCLEDSLVNAESKLMRLEVHSPPPVARPTVEIPLPTPPAWTTEADLKQQVIKGQVPTAIADAGCTSNCNMEFVSECGEYGLDYQPYVNTGIKLDKIFSYAGGGMAAATDINRMPFDIREPAALSHTVPGIQHNLLSTAKYIDAGYAWLFDNDEVQIFDKANTKITTSRAAVMKG